MKCYIDLDGKIEAKIGDRVAVAKNSGADKIVGSTDGLVATRHGED